MRGAYRRIVGCLPLGDADDRLVGFRVDGFASICLPHVDAVPDDLYVFGGPAPTIWPRSDLVQVPRDLGTRPVGSAHEKCFADRGGKRAGPQPPVLAPDVAGRRELSDVYPARYRVACSGLPRLGDAVALKLCEDEQHA